MSVPVIDSHRCSGCGRCVSACPERRYSLEADGYRKHAARREGDCRTCGKCFGQCPVGALYPGEKR
ncbi:4Fe-4S binding protein [Geomonas sp. Red276]